MSKKKTATTMDSNLSIQHQDNRLSLATKRRKFKPGRSSWMNSYTIVFIVIFAVIGSYLLFKGFAASPNVTVNFTSEIGQVNPDAFSGTISTYGSNGSDIANSAKQR